jgi:hypothetical protein
MKIRNKAQYEMKNDKTYRQETMNSEGYRFLGILRFVFFFLMTPLLTGFDAF